MNDVEQNIDRLLNLLVSTPALADQLVEQFDETLRTVDVEISQVETYMFLKGGTAHPTNEHFIPVAGMTSYSCGTNDSPNPFTVFITIFTQN